MNNNNWKELTTKEGSLLNYPRPQGNLPMFTFGLKPEAQQKFLILYKEVGKYTPLQ
jgi:hypothetical protein